MCRVTDDGLQTRAHLEAQLASALALNSPNEYRQCLLSYIRFLARFADPKCRNVIYIYFFSSLGIIMQFMNFYVHKKDDLMIVVNIQIDIMLVELAF